MTEFESIVLREISDVKVSVADISAKMDMLVGPNGNNGRFSEVVGDLESLKESRSNQRGFFAAITFVSGFIGAGLEWFLTRRS